MIAYKPYEHSSHSNKPICQSPSRLNSIQIAKPLSPLQIGLDARIFRCSLDFTVGRLTFSLYDIPTILLILTKRWSRKIDD